MGIPAMEKRWLNGAEACEVLGVGRAKVTALAVAGKIRTTKASEMAPIRYCAEDVRKLAEMPSLIEVREDGTEGFNLLGRAADWVGQTYLERLDSCWAFLMAHAYIDRDESERLRARIVADIGRSGSTAWYSCAAPTMEPLPNPYKGKV